jgi:sortase B
VILLGEVIFMNFIKSKSMLNVIILLACLTLLGTLFVAWQRYQSQKNFETMADIKKQQEVNRSNTTFDVPKLNSTNAVATSIDSQYIYKFNENAKWLDINPDYFGWIRVTGTNIDYPFVRSHDNKDYLTLDFNRNYSDAGSLFMDYRNLGNFNDKHTIIYGHYMKNKTLFHNLTLYHEKDFYEENQVIEIAGLYETKTYKIFSVYEISADDYAFTLDFDEEIDYQNYLETLKKLSRHTNELENELENEIEIDPTKRLLSLVTCSYGVGNGRTIIHAIEQ